MTRRTPASAITGLDFAQLPGAATKVAVGPDGSIWALSTQGLLNGDKYIYHYANGTWTNIPGAASHIAVAPNGTLWAVNAGGGIYSWDGTSWSTLAGGASDITVGSNGTIIVISSIHGGSFGNGIWQYNGSWSQLPGAGIRVVASWDTGTYPNGIAPGGFYVINAQLSIYYYNPSSGFVQIPGAAYDVAPTMSGGLFALGIGGSATQAPIYYDNLASGTWVQEPGAATSIAYNDGQLVVVGVGGSIYSSSVQVPSPQSTPPGVYISWTGLRLQSSSGFTSVQTTIEVPTITASGSINFWPGLEPSNGAYVLQPVVYYISTLYDDPSGINPYSAYSWECCSPANFASYVGAQAGDAIRTSMTLNGTTWTVNLTNPRNGMSSTLTYDANGTPQTWLFFLIETHYNIGAFIPYLNDFSGITFVNTSATSNQPSTTCNLDGNDETISQDTFSTPVLSNGGTTCSWASITVYPLVEPPPNAPFQSGDAHLRYHPPGI